jgi:hypothetical protein
MRPAMLEEDFPDHEAEADSGNLKAWYELVLMLDSCSITVKFHWMACRQHVRTGNLETGYFL